MHVRKKGWGSRIPISMPSRSPLIIRTFDVVELPPVLPMATGRFVLRITKSRWHTIISKNTAPSGDETLTPADAVKVLEELLPAQNQSYVLGLKMGLPLYTVDAIYERYAELQARLLHILIAFLKQADPGPTWRVIVDALGSPAVNLPHLAERVEAAHFPNPIATRDVQTQSSDNNSRFLICIISRNI